HLGKGNKVQLTGFGTFEVRSRKARKGVRPGTTERIDIPASTYPAFKPGKGLKDQARGQLFRWGMSLGCIGARGGWGGRGAALEHGLRPCSRAAPNPPHPPPRKAAPR